MLELNWPLNRKDDLELEPLPEQMRARLYAYRTAVQVPRGDGASRLSGFQVNRQGRLTMLSIVKTERH